MDDIILPIIILGFQAVFSSIVNKYILNESLMVNLIIQLIFALSSEPLIILFYGTNANEHVKRLFRKKRQIQPEPAKDYESVKNQINHKIENEYGGEIMVHESNIANPHLPQDINNSAQIARNGDDMNVGITPQDQVKARERKLLLLVIRCIGIGRLIGLCGATLMHVLYNSHINLNFGSVTNALFFVEFNTNNDVPSVTGAKYDRDNLIDCFFFKT